jgi:hypothetical protein
VAVRVSESSHPNVAEGSTQAVVSGAFPLVVVGAKVTGPLVVPLVS